MTETQAALLLSVLIGISLCVAIYAVDKALAAYEDAKDEGVVK